MDLALAELLEADEYGLRADTKTPLLARGLQELTEFHRERCRPYARMLEADKSVPRNGRLTTIPYLPVSVFKSLELRSIPDDEVFKVMTSSGTTGQQPSRIYLDVETARQQTRALSSIVSYHLGSERRPMLIVDHRDVLRDRRQFSARAAGLIGMMNFGRDHHFALDGSMALDRAATEAWLHEHEGRDLLIFGFTFMVWHDFLVPLRDAGWDLSRATVVHSGGWKKLVDEAVSKASFKAALRDAFGIEHVHDFYGMVEQVGSVYFECAAGFFHAPNFADVIVRDPRTWEPQAVGEAGVIEVLSLLPRSYPGHALLTEDLAILHGVDDCTCGAMGSRFEVIGRVPKVEIRGCSDTQERAA